MDKEIVCNCKEIFKSEIVETTFNKNAINVEYIKIIATI
jgi:hypothetical protein